MSGSEQDTFLTFQSLKGLYWIGPQEALCHELLQSDCQNLFMLPEWKSLSDLFHKIITWKVKTA